MAQGGQKPPEVEVEATEAGTRILRSLTGPFAIGLIIFNVAMSLFHVYTLGYSPVHPLVLRAVHLLIATAIVPVLLRGRKRSPATRPSAVDLVMIVLGVIGTIYVALHAREIELSGGVEPTNLDVIIGIVLVAFTLEATRRLLGLPLVIITVIFLLYAYFGPYMPGLLAHRGKSVSRIFGYMLSGDGLFGIPLHASSAYVFLFVLFGAFLRATGVSDFFMNLAYAVAGRTRGGPAKVAVFSSMLFGTISGSGIANIVTTGTLTIPLMKRTGYRSDFAAGVETVASCGGMLMPPIMGSAAFIMAEMINITYYEVMIAAFVPAVIYYSALFWMVDFEAARLGLRGLKGAELPKIKDVILSQGYLLIPVLALIYVLAIERSTPIRASLVSMVFAVGVSWVRKESRVGIRKIVKALAEGPRSMMEVASACATAGVIVGVITMTGIGFKFSALVIQLSGGQLFLALLLTMVVCIILGMGLPVTAAYILTASVAAPALQKLGVSPLQAHLFCFYFAIVSGVTPPVALGAYTAAGVAHSHPIKTAFTSMKLGMAAYIVPYMFIYAPSLLLVGSYQKVILAALTSFIGALLLASGLSGWLLVQASIPERLIILASAVMLIHPGYWTDLPGFGLGVLAVFIQISKRRRLREAALAEEAPPVLSTMKYSGE